MGRPMFITQLGSFLSKNPQTITETGGGDTRETGKKGNTRENWSRPEPSQHLADVVYDTLHLQISLNTSRQDFIKVSEMFQRDLGPCSPIIIKPAAENSNQTLDSGCR